MSESHPITQLAPSFDAARAAFVDAASTAGCALSTWEHPLRGLHDEHLSIDVAITGAADASACLVVVSGTHGVEGYAGSALQRHLLANRASELTDAPVRIVFVHALNPYGFSWVRRVNEDNVDLNRNFVDWTAPPPVNAEYRELAAMLVPDSWDAATQESSTLALLGHVERMGLEHMQAVVSGGQYDHPTGVFHGGSAPTWSHRWLEANAVDLVGSATDVGIIDFHTGLGPWSHGELISHEATDGAGYHRGTTWWGQVNSMVDGESVSAALSGDWLGAIERFLPGRTVTSAALEFGTVDPISVLQSLRADAWLHAHGDPRGEHAAGIRRQVWDAFLDDDPAWLAALVFRCDSVVDGAIAGLTAAV